MTTTKTVSSIAGLVLLTAAASVASLFGATVPADAAPDDSVAISVGIANETPPVKTIGSVAFAASADDARIQSLAGCQHAGGGQCVFEISAPHGCVVAAANDYGEIATAQGQIGPGVQPSDDAERVALSKLQSKQGAHTVVGGCSNGFVLPVAPPPAPPAPPMLGPTVSFKTILGGREADITDRSGVSSQCTYEDDADVNRSFALPANSTYDLKIVPAIPKFRDVNAIVTCDNGTKTQATTRF
jgi:hypothetical protein